MRITLFIADLGAGGAQRVLVNLAKYWLHKGNEVTVVTMFDQKSDFYSLDEKIKRCSFNFRSSLPLLRKMREYCSLIFFYKKQLAKSDVGISFIHSTNILCVFARLFVSQPLIISERNDVRQQQLNSFWRLLRYLFYRFADAITANQIDSISAMREYCPEHKLSLVYNPLPAFTTGISTRLPITEQINILSIGRLTEQKAHDLHLKVVAQLISYYPRLTYTIIGTGEKLPELKQLAADLKISKSVHFIEQTRDVANYYQQANILLMCSRFEGSPNVLYEAMAVGLPAVISDQIRESYNIIEAGENCIQVQLNIPEIVKSIKALINDADLYQRICVNSQASMKKLDQDAVYHSWERVIMGCSPKQGRVCT